jgi:pteridine reductase
VNAVAPGAVEWPEGENALSDEKKQASIEETPLKRHGEGRFIAKAVLSLIENEFVTGQTLAVDGGRSLI